MPVCGVVSGGGGGGGGGKEERDLWDRQGDNQ